MSPLIEHFTPSFESALIESTRSRLATTRFPDAETVEDWQQGLPPHYRQELVRYWLDDYDWQRVPTRLSAFDNFVTEIDGLPIHFLHIRSPHSDAQPLLMTHGWPGSVLEFLDVIAPLTNPTQHGGEAVMPFTWSYQPPRLRLLRQADCSRGRRRGHRKDVDALMLRLGYERYVAQGGLGLSRDTRYFTSGRDALPRRAYQPSHGRPGRGDAGL